MRGASLMRGWCGPLVWSVGLVLVFGAWGLFEWLAFQSDDGLTLSRFVFNVSKAWPPFIFFCGLTCGILAEHFWRYIDVGWRVPIDPALRWGLLAVAWAAVIILTGGGVAIFLAGMAVGLLVTRLWWQWMPESPNKRH